ncbi:MAG: HAMP domain-containing histidine kinase [Candidatus Cloacimonetes bacterium]|nr:HAMP domain-containing histidine kinase [Candidatus Cloacimonadota bacterium]
MKFGTQLKILNNKTSNIIKIYFIVGSVVILVGFLFFTNLLSQDIREDVCIVPDLYAQFIGLPDTENLENFLTDYFMTKIIPAIDYPIVFCDSMQVPFSWENINVEQRNYSSLEAADKERLDKMMKRLHRLGNYLPLYLDKHRTKLIGYVYFGETKSMRQLRYMPYVASVFVVIFIGVGAFALGYMRRNEKNRIWIGLAKETAHQFGTPTSSLMGWLQIMENRLEGDEANHELVEYINHMYKDVSRLQNVASRFGKVGSTIKLKGVDLDKLIVEIVEYFKNRVPTGKNSIKILYFSEIHDIILNLDEDLIKWSLENLLKNAIDAMVGMEGRIIVTAAPVDNMISIRISDEGRGLPRGMFKQIFLAGVTTKERGWGLGLSLAKRIIEEYHSGKIRVVQSEINKGTTIEILLPVVTGGENGGS